MFTSSQLFDEAVDVLGVVEKAIVQIGLIRHAHADEVGSDGPPQGGHVRYDVAPQVR